MKIKLPSLLLLMILILATIAFYPPQSHQSSSTVAKPNDAASFFSPVELDQVTISTSERQDWYEIIQWSDECENGWQSQAIEGGDNWGGMIFAKIDQGKFVVTVVCRVGPYWSSTEFFLLNNQSKPPQSEALTLDLIDVDNDGELIKYSASNISGGNPHFDAKTLTLTYMYKFRGVGGCGYYYRYKFIQDQFVLEEARYREVCDDTFPPPEEWAKIY